MNPTATALRAGWSRGLIELRQSFTNGADLWGHFFWPMLMVIATFFLRDVSFGSSGFLLGTLVLPSILGMISMSQQLTAEREDGTLLRAKATPKTRSATETPGAGSGCQARCSVSWSRSGRFMCCSARQ